MSCVQTRLQDVLLNIWPKKERQGLNQHDRLMWRVTSDMCVSPWSGRAGVRSMPTAIYQARVSNSYPHSAQYHRNGSHSFLKNILRISKKYYNFISALVQDVLKRKVLLQWFYKNGWIKEYQNYGGKWIYFCKSKIQVKSFVYVFFHYSDSSLKTGDVRSHLHH